MYFFGRGISAFFNQFFKWLFWNKTGQKLLFSVLIVFIFFCFIKLGEVSAVEEVNDINYEVKSYYDGVVNEAILRLDKFIDNNPNSSLTQNFLSGNFVFYFYYGNTNGSSYSNARPLASTNINIAFYDKRFQDIGNPTAYDYLGVTGYSLYTRNSNTYVYVLNGQGAYVSAPVYASGQFYFPLFVATYQNENLTNYWLAKTNGDTETIIELLNSIEASLTNTTPTSETDSFVEVDSSAVDDLSSSSVDNVFSNMTTSFSNKFTNYDLSTVNSFVWNLNGTRITFYSDTLYKMIRGTFFETLLSMLWYYIFGHYAFVWLSNIIHKIKDGSILDGLEVNEVITKEML